MPALVPRARILSISLAVVVAGLTAPSPGEAKVTIDPDRVVLEKKGAGVEVRRDPLRISFTDGDGRTVLAGIPGAEGASQVVPPVPRVQFATSTPPPPTLYSPLTFLVGSTDISQTPAGQWGGTLSTVSEGGTEYGATAVVDAERTGAGVASP